jgi:hypothetical protein
MKNKIKINSKVQVLHSELSHYVTEQIVKDGNSCIFYNPCIVRETTNRIRVTFGKESYWFDMDQVSLCE